MSLTVGIFLEFQPAVRKDSNPWRCETRLACILLIVLILNATYAFYTFTIRHCVLEGVIIGSGLSLKNSSTAFFTPTA